MFGCKDKLTPKSHADKCLVSIPILLRPYTSFLVSMLRNQRLFGLSSLPLSHPIAATPPDDSSLVKLAMTGDQAAFEDLMRLHHERTFRLVYSVVRHEQDARDVCQEVWLTVWKQLPQFRGDARFTTWLHPIAVRRSLDHLRKRKRWYDRFLPFSQGDENHSANIEPIAPVAPQRNDARDERIAQVRRALDTLPPKQRAVLALREIEGLSYEEIAATIKIPTGTVMSRIYHARRILAKKLGSSS